MVVTTAAATAPLLPSPRVWIRSAHAAASSLGSAQPCLFGKSMFDALLVADGSSSSSPAAASRHYDRQLVSLKEATAKQDYHVILEQTTTTTNTTSTQALPLGRARNYPAFGATACPAMVKGPPEIPDPKKPHPQLGVVGLVLDPSGERVLLTRRPSHMRTFPGAWVLPGGGWDAQTDELLEDCLQREILEETGLKIAVTREEEEDRSRPSQDQKFPLPVSLWESCFPTDPYAPGPIRSHYLVVFLRAYLAQESLRLLKLQESEVESALWLSVDQFQKVLEKMKGGTSTRSSDTDLLTIHNADGSTHRAPLDTIVGIYPQPDDKSEEFEWCGIAQGSLFALEELLLRSQRENNGQSLAGWDAPIHEGPLSSL